MKVLNLYACLGGNRQLWEDCEVTAVELDPVLAEMYQSLYPDDNVIVADAHKYLLGHYQDFDFIWSSPPCPSHSRARFWNTKAKRIYPDLKLYEEILFLQTHCKGKFCVENVKPYYPPLIPAQEIGRHLFWANFTIPKISVEKDDILGKKIGELVKGYSGNQRKDKIARNMVNPLIGNHIFLTAKGIVNSANTEQLAIF